VSLTDLTIAAARNALRARDFTARELTEAHLAAIDALNPRLNAFITVTGKRALAQADLADSALARGEFAPLTGIPLAIKDLFCTEGVRTTAGSSILGPFVPPYESTVSANLLRGPGARRFVRRFSIRSIGAAGDGCDRNRHRRFDPPARVVLRHRRFEADLWTLLALGSGGVRIVARSSRAFCTHRAGLRDPARFDGGTRPEGFNQRRYSCA
jgi:hypothetical protein